VRSAWLIARAEWRWLLRDRVVTAIAVIAVLVAIGAAFVAAERARYLAGSRARYQAVVDHQFESQPDRHPHRVVHYGHFVFRPPGELAGFDPGIESFVGSMVYLEGHRQNTANFGEARKSPLLLRFGELSPAFVLQSLWPLLVAFIGFGVIARERERGLLKPLLAQGVSRGALIGGKWLALVTVAVLLALPALAALVILGIRAGTTTIATLTLVGYLLYLAVWAGIVVAVSAISASSRTALFGCLAIWVLAVVALPRMLAELSSAAVALPTRVETDILVHRDLVAMGDSHNPDDPYFAAFRAKVLAQYGVTRIEDLPVNYAGLLSVEGERLTSRLFDEYAARSFERIEAQNSLVERFGVITPLVPIRSLSMQAAGSGWGAFRRFLEQAESYRFEIVQALNTMQAEKVTFADDNDETKEGRIDAANFRALPEFQWQPPARGKVLKGLLVPLGGLILWAALIAACLTLAARRLVIR
jgi:ABC-2 type transport system permease protein